MRIKKIATTLAACVVALSAFSQAPAYIGNGALLDGKTMAKANITSLTLGTFGFSAERILTKNLSAVLGISFMPTGKFPFADAFVAASGNDPQVVKTLNNFKINTFAFSPELRLYLSKTGYGKGFYIAPYYRYEQFGMAQMGFDFEQEKGTDIHLDLNGEISTHSGGLQLGVQWLIGKNKNIVIDWTILGLHVGTGRGKLTGVANRDVLTAEQQANLKKQLDEKLDAFSMIQHTSRVTANAFDVTINGPWTFLRGGLSVGFRF